MAQQAISPSLRRVTDAFNPTSVDVSDDSPMSTGSASAALSPTLQPASDASRSPTGGAFGPGISPLDPSHQFMKDYQDTVGKLSAAYAAPHAGMARQVLGALISNKNPAIGGLVSGETQRNRTIQPLQQQVGILGQIITANRQAELAGSTINRNNAYAGFEANRTGSLNTQKRNALEGQLNEKGLTGVWDENNNLTGTQPMPVSGLSAPAQADIGLKNADAGKANADIAAIPAKIQSAADVANIRAASAQGVANTRAGSAANVAGIHAFTTGAKVPPGTAKATADEQRRADLANNLSENLDQLEDIVKRRPDCLYTHKTQPAN